MQRKSIDEITRIIADDWDIPEQKKNDLLRKIVTRLQDTKVNILITGATGSGKSSTINALFDTEKAKIGQGVDPETMNIARYDLNNVVLFDSPGLGDGKDADERHAKEITQKLDETDAEGNPLIDLVLVILDGGSRDLGTSYQLITEVILPCLKQEKGRLLIAINQADMAMKGNGWNKTTNEPEPALVSFLDAKVASTEKRIRETTGVDVNVIYYAAGYKKEGNKQNPYNLSKLLAYIIDRIPEKKRIVVVEDVNRNSEMWKDDDKQENYTAKTEKSFMDSFVAIVVDVCKPVISNAVEMVVGSLGKVIDFLKFW
jgi:predicted GTPase